MTISERPMRKRTLKDLECAIAGESGANRRYIAFAQQAEEEGFVGVARLFRVAAEGETIHALNMMKAAGMVKSTEENLQSLLEDEILESEEFYPDFVRDAEMEGDHRARQVFEWAMKVEANHADLLKDALTKVEGHGDVKVRQYWVCETCGYAHIGDDPPRECPVCGSPARVFYVVE